MCLIVSPEAMSHMAEIQGKMAQQGVAGCPVVVDAQGGPGQDGGHDDGAI